MERLNVNESIDYLKSLGCVAEQFCYGNKENVENPKSICDVRHIICAEVENYQQYRVKYNEAKLGDVLHRIALFKNGNYEPYFYEDEVTALHWDKGITDYLDYYKIPPQ